MIQYVAITVYLETIYKFFKYFCKAHIICHRLNFLKYFQRLSSFGVTTKLGLHLSYYLIILF